MSFPDPTCTVNGLSTPVDVAASSTITIQLASPAGVRFWSVQCTSTDELDTPAAVNATLSINQTTKTATCTLSAVLGAAYIFTSIVGINGLGLDANSILQQSFTTTLKVNVRAANGARVLAQNEKVEQSAFAGWVAVINPALRAGVSIPTTVSGTGLVHATGSAIDPNALNGLANQFLVENTAGTDVTFVTIGTVLRGHINVTHAAPGTFDATHQIAYCDTSTGTCSITFPTGASFPGGSIPADWQLLVVDTAGNAGTNNITVQPNGQSTWSPNSLGFTTSAITLSVNGAAALWQWDSSKSHFVLVNTGSGGGSTTGAPVNIAGSHTVQPGENWFLIHPGDVVTMAVVPTTGLTLEFTTVISPAGAGFTINPCSWLGNGFTLQDPQDPNNLSGFAPSGTTVTGRTNNVTYRFRFDGSLYRCVGLS